MITHSDEDPEFEPDDPLAVILRPSSDHLRPPPGRYEAIRRTAARRRLLRTAVGVGVSCAVVTLVVLPLRYAAEMAPTTPTAPLAPPPASSPPPPAPSVAPTSPASPSPAPTSQPRSDRPVPEADPDGTTPVNGPSLAPPTATPSSQSAEGSAPPTTAGRVNPSPSPDF
ncbi:hypothetical protein [Streptomyces sp. NPDC059092]|uniref:hypothetical protein n=1 Tax=Streptomyces sp. NPDC059092 TaxID=3346725 RepID=UPI003678C609